MEEAEFRIGSHDRFVVVLFGFDPSADERSTPALTLGVLPWSDAKRNGRTPTVREGALLNFEMQTMTLPTVSQPCLICSG